MRTTTLFASLVSLVAFSSCIGEPRVEPYNFAVYDLRSEVAVTEIHWAGSVNDRGNSYDLDNFIEIKNFYYGDVDISLWSVTIEDTYGFRQVITIPQNTILKSGQVYTIGRTTNYAFSCFDLIYENLLIPTKNLKITVRDGSGKVIDNVDLSLFDFMVAGYKLPNLRKSMVRKIGVFGIEKGDNVDNWKSYSLPVASTNVRTNFASTTLCSPGEVLLGEF